MRAATWLGLVAVGSVAACAQIVGIEDARPGWTGSSGSSGSGSATTATSAHTGTGGGAMASSSSSSSHAAGTGGTGGTTSSTGGTTGTGGACTSATPCGFGQPCAADADCTTGHCNGKTCDAQTLVEGLTNPNSLVVDYWGVYWADGDDGTVMQAPFASLTTPGQLASGRTDPEALAITSPGPGMPSSLYWVEPSAGNIVEVGTQTLPQNANNIVIAQSSPAAVVATQGIYGPFWTTNVGLWVYSFGPNKLETFTSPGGKLAVVSDAPDDCYLVAYAGGGFLSVIYANDSGLCPTGTNTSRPAANVAGITMDAANVYWSDGATPGSVYQVPVTLSSAPVVVAPSQSGPTDVAVDAQNVYWINTGTAGMGEVAKAPIGGGAPVVVLASGQDTPRALFVTDTDVYWISGAKGSGAVKRIPK